MVINFPKSIYYIKIAQIKFKYLFIYLILTNTKTYRELNFESRVQEEVWKNLCNKFA